MTGLHRYQQKVLSPEVHVVVSPRGYGRTFAAEHCDRGCPWSQKAGTYPIDVQPYESADMALRYANNLRKWCLEHAPRTRPVVFMRREQWAAVKNFPRHIWLSRLSGGVVTMGLPSHKEYPDIFGPIESRERQRIGRLKDAWGRILPTTYKAVTNGATAEEAALAWVGNQPEHRLLLSALPDEGYYKTPAHLVLKRLVSAVERGDDTLERYNCSSPTEFLEWLELIGAGRRVQGPSWEWSQLWLTGCRELVKRCI